MLNRRTFLGSLISAVPSLGLLAKVVGADPVVQTWIFSGDFEGVDFTVRCRQSGETDVLFCGRPATLSLRGKWMEWAQSFREVWEFSDDEVFAEIEIYRYFPSKDVYVGRVIMNRNGVPVPRIAGHFDTPVYRTIEEVLKGRQS